LTAKILNSKIFRIAYPSYFLWDVKTDKQEVFLTFDDGPTPELSPFILSCLKEYGIKATFFCVGENVKKYPELFSEIIAQGHVVGNHTNRHLNGWKTSTKAYVDDVYEAQKLIQSTLFRPPYGRIRPSQAAILKKQYQIIMWSGLTLDYDKNIEPQKCLEIACKHIKKGRIIVFHDNVKAKSRLMYVLPKFIEKVNENKLTFSILK